MNSFPIGGKSSQSYFAAGPFFDPFGPGRPGSPTVACDGAWSEELLLTLPVLSDCPGMAVLGFTFVPCAGPEVLELSAAKAAPVSENIKMNAVAEAMVESLRIITSLVGRRALALPVVPFARMSSDRHNGAKSYAFQLVRIFRAVGASKWPPGGNGGHLTPTLCTSYLRPYNAMT